MRGIKTNRFYFYVFPYLLLVIIHILMGLIMQHPIIFPDELGYLGRARYLSGTSHVIQGSGFYHFGYSLFLLPAFWLFSDPTRIYSAIIITNALIVSSLYFALFYILHTLFKYPNRITSLISFTCCLYPAFVLQSNLAWSENVFVPFYVFFLASLGALLKHKSWPIIFLFAFISSFLYTIHPRAFLILPIAAIYLSVLAASKQLPKLKVLLSVVVMFLVFIITRFVNNFLSALDHGRTVDDYIKEKLFDLLSPSNLGPLALEISGQLLYLIEATYGLFLIGIVYVSVIVWKNLSNDRLRAFADIQFNIMLMLLLSSAGIFLASTVSILPVDTGAKLIYGRYNEGFLALYIVFALLAIRDRSNHPLRWGMNPYILSLIILTLTAIVLVGYDYATLLKWSWISNVNVINIFSLYPFIGVFRRLDLFIISLISILMLSVLIYAFRMKFILGICLLMIYFLFVSACGYTVFFVRSAYIRDITTLKYHIRSLDNIRMVSYDSSFSNSQTWFSYQYFLPDVLFKTFNSSQGQLPESKIVISGRNWKDAKKLGGKLLAYENSNTQVPPIMRKLIELFFEKPLVSQDRIDQALWLLPAGYLPKPEKN